MNVARLRGVLLAWLAGAVCVNIAAAQVTINVPADQPTIQAGIDAASNGDTVLVAPGTYLENINFKGKAITVKSSDGPAVTTIDGSNKASVVTFNTAETLSSIVDGFTITHGFDIYHGGGITVLSSSPTIQNNVITANGGIEGLGIYAELASPIIKNNTISGNFQNGGSGGIGGGISLLRASNFEIVGNTISNNHMASGGDGGGIGVRADGDGLISGNLIAANEAYNDAGGLAVLGDTSVLIENNLIVNNLTGGGGFVNYDGGVYLAAPAAMFVNNTLINNTLLVDSGSTLVQNNVSYGNGAIVPFACGILTTLLPTMRNNDFFSTNGIPNGGRCGTGVIGANGNVSVDPLLEDPLSDYHLTSSSPVIDAGLNTGVRETTDFDGKPRFMIGPNGCTVPATVDIGAYEYQSSTSGALSPSSVPLGTAPIGSGVTGGTPIHLQNTGTTCAGPLVFRFSNPDFSIGNTTCGTGLGSGLACDVYVHFVPSADGIENSSMTVTGGFTSPVNSVSLSGQGVAPFAGASPTSWDFGLGVLATQTSAQTFTISNSGDYALQVIDASASGDFAVTGYSCGVPVAPGDTCTVSATFTATALGLRAGTLTIHSDSVGGDVLIGLQGIGVTGDFIISSPTQPQTVAAGHAASFTIDTTPLGPPATVSFACSNLPSGASCSFNPGSVTSGSSSIMTINSMAPTSAAPSRARIAKIVVLNSWVLGIPWIVARRRRRLAAWSIIFVFVLGMAACGGAGAGDSKNRDGHTGTPPGSYVVTVTGTLGSVTRTTTVRLNIN